MNTFVKYLAGGIVYVGSAFVFAYALIGGI
jgi:hypothetical protein